MPISAKSQVYRDVPTRFDLYSVENAMESLSNSINDLTFQIGKSNDAVIDLEDRISELRISVDALTKCIERLPEQLPEKL